MAEIKKTWKNVIARLGQVDARNMKVVIEHGGWSMMTAKFVKEENDKAIELASKDGKIVKDIIVAYEIDEEASDALNSGAELIVDKSGKYVKKTARRAGDKLPEKLDVPESGGNQNDSVIVPDQTNAEGIITA